MRLEPLPRGSAVVGLARQSRGDDDTKSVEEQVARIVQECERNGWVLLDVHVEQDISGRRPLDKRPGLSAAIGDVERGRARAVLGAYFDRVVRSLKVQAEAVERVEKSNGRMLTIDLGEISNATAAQWLSATLIGAVSEYYSRSVSERSYDAKVRLVNAGIPPYPRTTPAYEKIPDGPDKGKLRFSKHAEACAEAVRMRAGIGYDRPQSHVAIARWLREQGVEITPTGVQSMIESPLIVGEIRWGKLVNLHAHEPLVDRQTQRRAKGVRKLRGRRAKSEHLLARLHVLHCDACGARMVVHTTSSGNSEWSYYKCGNRLCTQRVTARIEETDAIIRNETIRLSSLVTGRADAAAELEAARIAAAQAEAKLASAIRSLAGLDEEAATKETLDELRDQRDAAVDEHARLQSFSAPGLTLNTLDDWGSFSLAEKRLVIRTVIERAEVLPGDGPAATIDRIVIIPR